MALGQYAGSSGVGARNETGRVPSSPGYPGAVSSNDNHRGIFGQGRADELDCLRGMLAPELLIAAERRARHVGTGADRVLIQWGVIDEAAYLKRLSRHTGLAMETLAGVERRDLPLYDRQIAQAAE